VVAQTPKPVPAKAIPDNRPSTLAGWNNNGTATAYNTRTAPVPVTGIPNNQAIANQQITPTSMKSTPAGSLNAFAGSTPKGGPMVGWGTPTQAQAVARAKSAQPAQSAPVPVATPMQQPVQTPGPVYQSANELRKRMPYHLKGASAMDVNYLRKTAEQLFGKTAQGLVAPGAKPALATRAWGNDTELDRQFGSAKPPVEGKPAKVGGGTAPAQQFKAQLAQVKQPPTQLDTPTYT